MFPSYILAVFKNGCPCLARGKKKVGSAALDNIVHPVPAIVRGADDEIAITPGVIDQPVAPAEDSQVINAIPLEVDIQPTAPSSSQETNSSQLRDEDRLLSSNDVIPPNQGQLLIKYFEFN